MFNDCPAEIKKMIFARVRYMDLYEVSVVSQEWWTLTLATCSPTSDKYSRFLKFQVKFCNEMMPKEGGWKPWMFVEFTDDKSIELVGPPDEKIVEYLRRKDIRVRKLIYFGDDSILPKLKALFPHLQTLVVTLYSFELNGEAVELPAGLKRLHFTLLNTYPGLSLIDVFEHLEHVTSLNISTGQRILFNGIIFDGLKKLHLDINEQSTDEIKALVTGSKQLSFVSLKRGLIDKEWLGLFPTNIKKIYLDDMQSDDAIAPWLETANAFIERQLMRFVCQDWTKIRLFKYSDLWSTKRYGATYICRPLLLEEELVITMNEGETPSGLLDSGKLQLKLLKLSDFRDTKCDLGVIVPKSVQHFELEANDFEAINVELLFEDISTINKLRINSIDNKTIQIGDIPNAVNLVSLDISVADEPFLASILSNCPSLKQLSLHCPQGLPFSELSAGLKSPSLKQLTIIEPKDSIGNILGHFSCLVDLNVKYVNMQTVNTTDLAKLTSVGFVRIIFKNVTDLVTYNLVVNCLDELSYSHLILGYSCYDPYDGNETLSCVMGREKAFFRRYLCLNTKKDFTKMNMEQLGDCYIPSPYLYLKGVPSLHLSHLSEFVRITYDLQEFIANTSAAIQENNLVLQEEPKSEDSLY